MHLCPGGEVFAEKTLASLTLLGRSVVPGQCLYSVNVTVHDSLCKRSKYFMSFADIFVPDIQVRGVRNSLKIP